MRPWSERPQIEATLLNPALFAVSMSVAARAYEQRAHELMIWPLAFLVPPLILHRPTREALPKTVASHLATWIGRQPLFRAGFPARAQQLTPMSREGLRLGLRTGVLSVEAGRLRGTLDAPDEGGDLFEVLKAAKFLGRWLPKVEQPSSVFALLGVRP
jgi:hypothetical protein